MLVASGRTAVRIYINITNDYYSKAKKISPGAGTADAGPLGGLCVTDPRCTAEKTVLLGVAVAWRCKLYTLQRQRPRVRGRSAACRRRLPAMAHAAGAYITAPYTPRCPTRPSSLDRNAQIRTQHSSLRMLAA